MFLYSDGARGWCSAAPMVRISANTSKPSNVHPRFEATSAFHCARLSERYHGEGPTVPNSLMFPPLKISRPRLAGGLRISLRQYPVRLKECDEAGCQRLQAGT